MIERSLLMNNAISRESLQKFLTELHKRTDNVIATRQPVGFGPQITSLLVDAIELWEQRRANLLSMQDIARLYPEETVFPASKFNRNYADNRLGLWTDSYLWRRT